MEEVIDFLLNEFKQDNTVAYLSSTSAISEYASIFCYIPVNKELAEKLKEKHYLFNNMFKWKNGCDDNLMLMVERDDVRIDFFMTKNKIIENNATNGYIRLSVPYNKKDKLKKFLMKYHISVNCIVQDLEQMQKELAKIQNELFSYTNMIVFLNNGD